VEIANPNQAGATAGEEPSKKLGAFLKTEREKMKLSQDQIAQKMRLRRFVIEAIENEAWDRLPPPVFVRGFVRSYARTLDLDEKKALELYSLAAPPDKDTLRPVALARTSNRGRTLLILAALILVLCVFYYWHLKSSARDRDYMAMVELAPPAQKQDRSLEKVQEEAPQPLVSAPAREEVHAEPQPSLVPKAAPKKVLPPEEEVHEEDTQTVVAAPPAASQSQRLILKGPGKGRNLDEHSRGWQRGQRVYVSAGRKPSVGRGQGI
jgi:cytoskeleton protein RodZ